MKLATVAIFKNPVEAEIAENFLKANGIRTYATGGVLPTEGTPMAAPLQVAERDLEQATKLLEKANKGRRQRVIARHRKAISAPRARSASRRGQPQRSRR